LLAPSPLTRMGFAAVTRIIACGPVPQMVSALLVWMAV
jgi:hypothetical protein